MFRSPFQKSEVKSRAAAGIGIQSRRQGGYFQLPRLSWTFPRESTSSPIEAGEAGAVVSVKVYRDPDAIPGEDLVRWRDLENRALLDNAYLSADFILPALKHLHRGREILIVMAERRTESGVSLIGVGVFEARKKGGVFPYLIAYKSDYSFQSGLLLDRNHYQDTLLEIFAWIRTEKRWNAVVFIDRPPLTGEAGMHGRLKAAGIRRQCLNEKSRAVLIPREGGEAHLKEKVSPRTRKSLKRKMRQLGDMGRLEWRFVPSTRVGDGTIEDFLRLENMGWKRDMRTSLKSRPDSQAFFMDFIGRFRLRGQVFFTELVLDDEVIASTCNITSGSTGFAFKLGWDPAFSRQSVGFLNEYHLVSNSRVHLGHIALMDSGAEPGSFLEHLWTDSRMLLSDVYSLNYRSYLYICCFKLVLAMKRRLRKKRRKVAAGPA